MMNNFKDAAKLLVLYYRVPWLFREDMKKLYERLEKWCGNHQFTMTLVATFFASLIVALIMI